MQSNGCILFRPLVYSDPELPFRILSGNAGFFGTIGFVDRHRSASNPIRPGAAIRLEV
jgi:hypothetical protein